MGGAISEKLKADVTKLYTILRQAATHPYLLEGFLRRMSKKGFAAFGEAFGTRRRCAPNIDISTGLQMSFDSQDFFHTLERARSLESIECSICGETAGDPVAITKQEKDGRDHGQQGPVSSIS